MARARNIKPGLYKNEDLAECSVWARFIFPGLWMLADREGRLEDRPRRIKGELLPYDEVAIEPLLDELAQRGFILRYGVDGRRYIQVTRFAQHQTPHAREQASTLPAPPASSTLPEISTLPACPSLPAAVPGTALVVPDTGLGHGLPSPGSPDSLIPSTLNPSCLIADSRIADSRIADSRIADSPIPDPGLPIPEGSGADLPAPGASAKRRTAGKPPPDPQPDAQQACRATWHAYAAAYLGRYGTEPVRNATVNAQVRALVRRLGPVESPPVAAFFVRSEAAFYVQRMHAFGNLLADAEKVRTEWATGRRMTAARARQLDQTGANASVAAEALELLARHGAAP